MSDTVLKLKHRLFIEKDFPFKKIDLIWNGAYLPDSMIISSLQLHPSKAFEVKVFEEKVLGRAKKFDVVLKNDECFVRFKDKQGYKVYRQFGDQ